MLAAIHRGMLLWINIAGGPAGGGGPWLACGRVEGAAAPRLSACPPVPCPPGPAPRRAAAEGRTLGELAAELRERLALVRQGGDERSRRRHLERGKLLVRERVDRLLDPGASFLELSPLAAWELYGEPVPAAGSGDRDRHGSRGGAAWSWPTTPR